MWLNTEETLQAATTFTIFHKNKDTRLQIILCKPEIVYFPFIKQCLIMLFTFIVIISTLPCMLCLMSEVGGGKSIVWQSKRVWVLLWTNKICLGRFSSGIEIHTHQSILLYSTDSCLQDMKKSFSTQFKRSLWCKRKSQNYVNDQILVWFDVWVMDLRKIIIIFTSDN